MSELCGSALLTRSVGRMPRDDSSRVDSQPTPRWKAWPTAFTRAASSPRPLFFSCEASALRATVNSANGSLNKASTSSSSSSTRLRLCSLNLSTASLPCFSLFAHLRLQSLTVALHKASYFVFFRSLVLFADRMASESLTHDPRNLTNQHERMLLISVDLNYCELLIRLLSIQKVLFRVRSRSFVDRMAREF